MEISKDTILNLAMQLYLNLTEEDMAKLPKELGNIVEKTKILDEVNISNVKPDVSVLSYNNVFRDDVVEEFKEKDLLLQNAEEVYNDMFKIPKILN